MRSPLLTTKGWGDFRLGVGSDGKGRGHSEKTTKENDKRYLEIRAKFRAMLRRSHPLDRVGNQVIPTRFRISANVPLSFSLLDLLGCKRGLVFQSRIFDSPVTCRMSHVLYACCQTPSPVRADLKGPRG